MKRKDRKHLKWGLCLCLIVLFSSVARHQHLDLGFLQFPCNWLSCNWVDRLRAFTSELHRSTMNESGHVLELWRK